MVPWFETSRAVLDAHRSVLASRRITSVEAWTVLLDAGRAAMKVIRTSELEPVAPPDGSEVREIARPPDSARNQSLAEATIQPGGETAEHYHRAAEEIYYFVSGAGRMRLGDEETEVGPGETVVIPPGTRHKLQNTGSEPLVLLCCSSPPYYDEDTVVTE